MPKTMMDTIVEVCEGNPGALSVCMQLLEADMVEVVEMMRRLDITGSDVWMLYKDECGEKIDVTVTEVLKRFCEEKVSHG